jgi:hypothetical protein
MRGAVFAVVLVVAVVGCRRDENIIDAPAVPGDASDGGVPMDGVAIDASACAACGPNQICVAYHDGTCSQNIQIECQDLNPQCSGNCIQDRADCEFWQCRRGMDAGGWVCYSCPNDIPGAMNCHGA